MRTFAAAPETVRLTATAWHQSDAQRDMAPERIAELARLARPELDVQIAPTATVAITRARAAAGEREVVLLVGDGLANAWEELSAASGE